MRLEIHDGSNWGDDGDTTPTICTMNADGSCGPPRLMIQSFGKDKAAEELAEKIVKSANLHGRLVAAVKELTASHYNDCFCEACTLLAECK